MSGLEEHVARLAKALGTTPAIIQRDAGRILADILDEGYSQGYNDAFKVMDATVQSPMSEPTVALEEVKRSSSA